MPFVDLQDALGGVGRGSCQAQPGAPVDTGRITNGNSLNNVFDFMLRFLPQEAGDTSHRECDLGDETPNAQRNRGKAQLRLKWD